MFTYQNTFYITISDKDIGSLEIATKNNHLTISQLSSRGFGGETTPDKPWGEIILSLNKWLKIVKKNWIKANKIAHESYPFNYRYGVVSNSLIRSSLPEIYRIDKELGKAKTDKFIRLVESGYFRDNEKTTLQLMTANDYFNYCKIAYISGMRRDEKIDTHLTGREMYKRYADGRDEGLLEIDGDSKKEFADWIDHKHSKRSSGGHPWEIKRGGNTTHIDLYVSRPNYSKDGFIITLAGASISRLKETICMFLGIYDAGLPITISDPEGIRLRLLAQDNIGIVPRFYSLHRENQRFRKDQNVYDVLYYDDIGRYKRRLLPFISWESLPLLIPL